MKQYYYRSPRETVESVTMDVVRNRPLKKKFIGKPVRKMSQDLLFPVTKNEKSSKVQELSNWTESSTVS